MNKFAFAIIMILLIVVLPVIGSPELLWTFKIITIAITGILLMLTQPKFSISETKKNKNTDKNSVLMIMAATCISVIMSEIEWAYWGIPVLDVRLLSLIGLTMMIGGITFRIWAILTMGKNFTATVRIKKEHELIRTGPYAIVRHPSYSGAFLMITGIAVFLESLFSIFLTIFLMVIVYYIRIKSEEKVLINHFGNNYINYAKDKKRLFPFIW